MPEAYRESDTANASGAPPARGPTAGTPRWVKVGGVIAVVLVLLIGGLVLFGGGSHSPGRHLGGDSPSREHTPPSSGPQDEARPSGGSGRHAPPAGSHP